MFSVLMARLFSTWQRSMRTWEIGTKNSPKFGNNTYLKIFGTLN